MTSERWKVVVEVNVTNLYEKTVELREAVQVAEEGLRTAVAVAPQLSVLEGTIEEATWRVQEMGSLCRTLEEMLPRGRKRRGLLDIGGKIIKVLFGNPDADDYRRLQDKLEKVDDQQAGTAHLLDDLMSVTRMLSQQASDNSDKIRRVANDVARALAPILGRVRTLEDDARRTETALDLYVNASTLAANLNSAALQGLVGLRDLVKDIQNVNLGLGISVNLLSPVELSLLLVRVQTLLPRGLNLVTGTSVTDVYRYYDLVRVRAHSVGHVVRILIDLPLASPNHLFKRFQVRTFPVYDAATKVSWYYRVPEEDFLLSEDQELHGRLPMLTRERCQGKHPAVCQADEMLYYRQHPICLSALYRGDQRDVDQLCERVVLATPHQPVWVWDETGNQWYYSVARPEKLVAECRGNGRTIVKETSIEGTGQLVAVQGCTYRTDGYVLFRREQGSNTFQWEKQVVRFPIIPVLQPHAVPVNLQGEVDTILGELVAEGQGQAGPYGVEIPFNQWRQRAESRGVTSTTTFWAVITGGLAVLAAAAGAAWHYHLRPKSSGSEGEEVELPPAVPFFRLSTVDRRRMASLGAEPVYVVPP